MLFAQKLHWFQASVSRMCLNNFFINPCLTELTNPSCSQTVVCLFFFNPSIRKHNNHQPHCFYKAWEGEDTHFNQYAVPLTDEWIALHHLYMKKSSKTINLVISLLYKHILVYLRSFAFPGFFPTCASWFACPVCTPTMFITTALLEINTLFNYLTNAPFSASNCLLLLASSCASWFTCQALLLLSFSAKFLQISQYLPNFFCEILCCLSDWCISGKI